MTETKEIKMPPKKMLSVLYLQYGSVWTLIALAGVIAFITAGFFDPRFFFLALIWIFLVIPLVVAFLYFVYGMNPLTVFNTIPHTIIFDDSEIRVHILKETDENPEKKEKGNDPADTHDKDYKVSKDLFKCMKSGGDYVLIFFKKIGWLWVPVNSFESYEEFKSTMSGLNIQKQKAS